LSTLNFDEFFEALDDDPFEERPVDLDTFLHSEDYLNQPELSEIQRDLVEAMSQIYKEEDLIRMMGEENGKRHYNHWLCLFGLQTPLSKRSCKIFW
jgi:hypothetical protein